MTPQRIRKPHRQRGVGSKVQGRFGSGNSTTRRQFTIGARSVCYQVGGSSRARGDHRCGVLRCCHSRHAPSPSRHIVRYGNTMSLYSVGPYGSISIAAFVVLGLGALALSLGFRHAVTPSRALRVGYVLVGLFGLGFCLAGIFRLAPNTASIEQVIKGANPTIAGAIHGLGGFGGIFCLIVGMIVLSRAFERDERWRSFCVPSLVLGLITLVLFAIGLFVLNSPSVIPCCPTGSVAWRGRSSGGSSSGRLSCGYCSHPSRFASSPKSRSRHNGPENRGVRAWTSGLGNAPSFT
jgi:hypothetical protein